MSFYTHGYGLWTNEVLHVCKLVPFLEILMLLFYIAFCGLTTITIKSKFSQYILLCLHPWSFK
jgi:hypothetical protein